jgi:formate hydrogenlyase subunit 3/multisubunit Na+/H+ antiporter MnhD subunit
VQGKFPLAQWGLVISLLGTITLFTGTMQALRQDQTKRLLAFHSIGQVGYILLGVGACMALLQVPGSNAAAALATLALFGALFHVLNHGLFKGLLFLNAGSLLYATETQDLNKMGGLMKFMPVTGVTALVASFSISGVPLFNGFVSKWSIFVATMQGSEWARYLAVCAAVAILTSALTLASFIKFFGVSFLSRAGTHVMEQAAQKGRLEPGWLMLLPQVALALACVFLGVVPAAAFLVLQRAMEASPQGFGILLAATHPVESQALGGLQVLHLMALFAPIALASVLAAMFLLVWGLSKLGRAPRRVAAPWLCGYVIEADCYRYTAHNFYGEIKRYFRWLGGAARPLPGTQPQGKRH